LPDLFARHDCRTNLFKITPVTTLTGCRLRGPSGFLPPSSLKLARIVETTRPALVGKAAMLSMTRPQAYEISIHARIYPGGNRKDRTGFAGDTLQEQDTFYSMPFHLIQHVIA
jgi:hypothetical protein